MDEILMAAATALATKMANAAADGGFKALHQAVHRAFSRHPSYQKALENAEAEPGNDQRVQALARALSMASAQDPAFKTALYALAPEINIQHTHHTTVSAHAEASNGGVTVQNVFGAVYGNASIANPAASDEQ